MYAVVETPTGHAYHLPLPARVADDIRPGDIVSFTSKPEPRVRPVDRHIADVVRSRDGVYRMDLRNLTTRLLARSVDASASSNASVWRRRPVRISGLLRSTCSKSSTDGSESVP